MIQEQIKKLATTLYGYENLEVRAVLQTTDKLPYKAGMWIAFVSQTEQDCPNELLRDLDTGWGLSEEGALNNLRERLLRQLDSIINQVTTEMTRFEKTKKELEKFLKVQKEVRETA
jgi:hypothetical protein